MRKFIEEYGFVILIVLAIIALIMGIGPIGALMGSGMKDNVNSLNNEIQSNLPQEVEKFEYTIICESESGKKLDEYSIKYPEGSSQIITPKSYAGYVNPAPQRISFDEQEKEIKFVYDLVDYTIVVNFDGGRSASNQNIPATYTVEDASITLPKDIVKADSVFIGYTGTNLTAPSKEVIIRSGSTGNRNYVANYEQIQKITISFDSAGGSVVNSQQIESGSNLASLPTSSRNGYDFLGWYNGSTKVDISTQFTQDTTLVAKWKAKHVVATVIHESTSGKELDRSTVAYDFGQNVVVNPKSFTGYQAPSAVHFTGDLRDEVVLEYEPIEYSINYDLDGGKASNPESYTIEDETIQLKAPIRDVGTFVGWTGSNGSTPMKNASITKGSTGNKTFMAHWNVTYELVSGPTFENKFDKNTITQFIFTDKPAPSGATVIDVDADKDGGVVSWVDGTTVYVSTQKAGQKVVANANASSMFSDYLNCTHINVSNLDVSNVTYMNNMFYNTGKNNSTNPFIIKGLDTWNVSNVTYMSNMFYYAGRNADTFDIGNIGNWDVSNVTNMNGMFNFAGENATTWSIGDLSNWDVSNIINMNGIFSDAGLNATTWNIGDLSNWNVSNVTNMSYMFSYAGQNATTFDIGNIGNWDVSNVTNMNGMFNFAGENATTWSIGDLSNWDVSNATNMISMFRGAGQKATTFDIGDIGKWDVSNVTDMSFMFSYAGQNADTFNIGNIGNWDVSNVTNMNWMFGYAGQNVDTFNIGNIGNWDVSNVTNMYGMFGYAGQNATPFTLDLSGWDASKVSNMQAMFYETGANKILTPKNIRSDVSLKENDRVNLITDRSWYDLTDNNKEYPKGTFPVGNGNVSHVLMDLIVEASFDITNDGTGEDGVFKPNEKVELNLTLKRKGNRDCIVKIIGLENAIVETDEITLNSSLPKTIKVFYTVKPEDIERGELISKIRIEYNGIANEYKATIPTIEPSAETISELYLVNEGTGENGAFQEGDIAEFDLVIKNTGTMDLEDITISGSKASFETTSVSLKANESITIKGTYTIKARDVESEILIMKVVVTTPGLAGPIQQQYHEEVPLYTPPINPLKLLLNFGFSTTVDDSDLGYPIGEPIKSTFTITNPQDYPFTNLKLSYVQNEPLSGKISFKIKGEETTYNNISEIPEFTLVSKGMIEIEIEFVPDRKDAGKYPDFDFAVSDQHNQRNELEASPSETHIQNEYEIRVKYIKDEAPQEEVAPEYVGKYLHGETYAILSPAVPERTPDFNFVRSSSKGATGDISLEVRYKLNPKPPGSN